ncbi:hypothetical protein HDV63DRAFT_381964 [Trichoderma sp. SZMC 28014]
MKLNYLAVSASLSMLLPGAMGKNWLHLYTDGYRNNKGSFEVQNPGCFTYNGATWMDLDLDYTNHGYFLVQFATADGSCQLPIACVLIPNAQHLEPVTTVGLFSNFDADYHFIQILDSHNFIQTPYELCTRYNG